jgi:hypothetical protein
MAIRRIVRARAGFPTSKDVGTEAGQRRDKAGHAPRAPGANREAPRRPAGTTRYKPSSGRVPPCPALSHILGSEKGCTGTTIRRLDARACLPRACPEREAETYSSVLEPEEDEDDHVQGGEEELEKRS